MTMEYSRYDGEPQLAPASPPPPVIDMRRLWGGGLATALVAALVAWVAVLIARAVFHAELLTPESRGLTRASGTTLYVISAGAGALIATLILLLMVALTPRPLAYFGWIIGLITVACAVLPFTVDAPLLDQLLTGFANLAVGLVILTLLPKVGYSTIRPGQPAQPPPLQ
ncbi:hypothetical protein FXF51_03325 [Nonomuraea sp. PA05]|uniref:DUF6069 family protein n=1 Tax=Nonomuraea sp. PA05 TaxID=2604466 RepID=UPI0011DA0EF6|nr:DUF6069 family protein [Nonomuraea sp. PA05]TYB70126.1 hypothetical protein FXF51_03325 [Nonomuraea sp. PA05]